MGRGAGTRLTDRPCRNPMRQRLFMRRGRVATGRLTTRSLVRGKDCREVVGSEWWRRRELSAGRGGFQLERPVKAGCAVGREKVAEGNPGAESVVGPVRRDL